MVGAPPTGAPGHWVRGERLPLRAWPDRRQARLPPRLRTSSTRGTHNPLNTPRGRAIRTAESSLWRAEPREVHSHPNATPPPKPASSVQGDEALSWTSARVACKCALSARLSFATFRRWYRIACVNRLIFAL